MKRKPKILRQRKDQDRALKTRKSILDSAGKLIAEVGFHNVKAKDIADKAGIPSALLTYHFPNFDALINDLVLVELEKVKVESMKALEGFPDDPYEALLAYGLAPLKTAKKDKVFRAVVSYFYHMASTSERFLELNTSIRTTGRDRILSLVSLVRENKGFEKPQSQMSLQETATAIHAVITGYFTMYCTESVHSSKFDYAHCEKGLTQSIKLLLS